MQKMSLFYKLAKKGFNPKQVAEVGVYHPQTSNIYDYIIRGVKCILVEPDPKSLKLIKRHFSNFDNVTLYGMAIYDYNGTIELIQRKASTFVSKLPNTPSIVNDRYRIKDEDKFIAECKTFDKIDDGNIDLLSIDVEGSEWFVLKHMISRPTVISVETHGSAYLNPFLNQIREWMKANNYGIWYKTGSDTIFVQKDRIKISRVDRCNLLFQNALLILKRNRKRIKMKISRVFQ